jgi:endonuclease/exonuclease/phosphatase family metal-dependent hydrolase
VEGRGVCAGSFPGWYLSLVHGVAKALLARGLAFAAFVVSLATATDARATELRVVSFNVAMGAAFGGPLRGLLRETFEEHEHLRGFDVIGLQEACVNDPETIEPFRVVMQKVHGRAYSHAVLENSRSREKCKKAEVILSRFPIVDSGGIDLPRIGARRSAAWVDVRVGSETLRIYDLHLSNRHGRDFAPIAGRWEQASIVLDHWLRAKRRDTRLRGVVLGDFNSMGNLVSPVRQELTIAAFSRVMTPNLVGYVPTMWLPYQTDWIFSSGLGIRRSYVIPTVYSDHYVVMADYVL